MIKDSYTTQTGAIMTSKELKKYHEKMELKCRKYQENISYFLGLNPPIFQPLPKSAPDNRIPIPYGTKALMQYGGYMGKVGTISYAGDYYETVLKAIFDFNDEALITYSELQEAMKHGTVYELVWLDKNGSEVNFKDIPFDQGLPIYSDDLKKALTGFVWMREIENDEDEIYLATYWDQYNQEEWTKKEKDKDWTFVSTTPHAGQGIVPVNIGQINKDGTNLIEHVKSLIDFVDKLFSTDVANESERFSAALLLFADRLDQITVDEQGLTFRDKLKEIGVIDGLGDDPVKKVQYLTRNIPTEFIKFAFETADMLIHNNLPLIDASADKMGSDTAGVALEWKTWPFELRCADIEAWFSRFLQNRIYIISKMLGNIKANGGEVTKVDIRFTRNLPRNVTEMVDNFVKVSPDGLSIETALKLLPADIMEGGIMEEVKRIKADMPDEVMPVKEVINA
jgi:SPP1 family phage portal protein